MVKITLNYPNLPVLTIDSSVEECVQLLRALARDGSPPARRFPVVDTPSPAPAPAAETPRPDVTGANDPHGHARLYGGKRNRRDIILEIFHLLHEEGLETVSLDQIRQRYQESYPEEDQQHLDQVIRDLANKTDLVAREGRGRFRLAQ